MKIQPLKTAISVVLAVEILCIGNSFFDPFPNLVIALFLELLLHDFTKVFLHLLVQLDLVEWLLILLSFPQIVLSSIIHPSVEVCEQPVAYACGQKEPNGTCFLHDILVAIVIDLKDLKGEVNPQSIRKFIEKKKLELLLWQVCLLIFKGLYVEEGVEVA